MNADEKAIARLLFTIRYINVKDRLFKIFLTN